MQISGEHIDTQLSIRPNIVRNRRQLWRSRSLDQLNNVQTYSPREENFRRLRTSDQDSWCSALTNIHTRSPHPAQREIATGINIVESDSSDSFYSAQSESPRIRAPLDQAGRHSQRHNERDHSDNKSGGSDIIDAISYNILSSTIGADVLAYYGYDWFAAALMLFMVVLGLLEGCYTCAEYLNKHNSTATPRIERRWFHAPCKSVHRIFKKIGQNSAFIKTSAKILRVLYRPLCLIGSLGTGGGDFIQHTYNGVTRSHYPNAAEICSSLAIIIPTTVALAYYLYGHCNQNTPSRNTPTTSDQAAADNRAA